ITESPAVSSGVWRAGKPGLPAGGERVLHPEPGTLREEAVLPYAGAPLVPIRSQFEPQGRVLVSHQGPESVEGADCARYAGLARAVGVVRQPAGGIVVFREARRAGALLTQPRGGRKLEFFLVGAFHGGGEAAEGEG